jgi:hypothetical protein
LQPDVAFALPFDRPSTFKMGHTTVTVTLRRKRAGLGAALLPAQLQAWGRRTLAHLQGSGAAEAPTGTLLAPAAAAAAAAVSAAQLQPATLQLLPAPLPLPLPLAPALVAAGAAVGPSAGAAARVPPARPVAP